MNDPDYRVITYHSENSDVGKEWVARVDHPRTKLTIFFEASTEVEVNSKANDWWNEFKEEREENWRKQEEAKAARLAKKAEKEAQKIN